MPGHKLTNLELRIMEALWTRGQASIREIQETFPAKRRPAYTTIQTTVYRLEVKRAVRRVKKVIERIDKTAARVADVPESELDALIDEAVNHVRHHPAA